MNSPQMPMPWTHWSTRSCFLGQLAPGDFFFDEAGILYVVLRRKGSRVGVQKAIGGPLLRWERSHQVLELLQ